MLNEIVELQQANTRMYDEQQINKNRVRTLQACKEEGVTQLLGQLPALLMQANTTKPETQVVRQKRRRKSSFIEPELTLFRDNTTQSRLAVGKREQKVVKEIVNATLVEQIKHLKDEC